MADEHTYTLIVDASGLEQEKSAVTPSGATASRNTSSQGGGTVGKNMEKAVVGMVSYATAASFADQLVTNELSVVELSTGAREYEQRLQYGYSLGKTAVNAAVSLGVGIATGTWPVVLAGLAVAGVGKAISLGQEYRKLEMRENIEDIGIGFAQKRAGVSGRRGSTQ